ncbi:anaerobic nitric oxide reductase transcription regulator [Luteibacter rhizovicinus]|uniref:Anaerobic nitric oxide reductase transcription regulator n=1 Tax=Luteibacter rhizovicinus TaxID=242606 RepID=A0A4V2W3P6_9GAMM|nr:nitric oxide reductase transcriptional regulator NorR [Luteibacter rhizovicinus]TCV92749.1 anaerobic nitric oxide reductase transcription regulator [Luteibacter rhizovicinus]
MTPASLLSGLLPLVADLTHDIDDAERYKRLLKTLREHFPCDATAILRLDNDILVPLSVDGLSEDTLGRRFSIHEHPRLKLFVANEDPTRFPHDSPLPDPYDGLIPNQQGRLLVHDCMGCRLRVDGRTWGVITLDSLAPGSFESVDLSALASFASLAAATVVASERMTALRISATTERRRAEAYRNAVKERTPRGPIGQSEIYRRLMEEIRVVATSDLNVLIQGETGTGKELVARAIHAASARATQPLVNINCAALPENLVESELFGHVRGAFSGATGDRRGKFELADKGTLFLDEVGELSPGVQAKLLRVVQTGQLQRVGSDREHTVDVRVIAATNRDLAEAVKVGSYRADLFHRLSVYPLTVPALRERGRDVLLLAGAFLEEARARAGLAGIRLAADAQDALLAHPWPGNVRELEHLIGRSVLRAMASRRDHDASVLTLTAETLDLSGSEPLEPETPLPESEAPRGTTLRAMLESHERRIIQDQLERHDGNWAATARSLGVDRANLARSARRLGLR